MTGRARLLHIDASPRGERSRSRSVAERFLTALRERADAPEIEVLDIWNTDLPELDGGMIEGRYALIMGHEVPPQIAQAWHRIRDHAEHFLSFDAYLVSTPMWNFGLPYRLKQLIDVVTQPGMVFTNDAQGHVTGAAAGKKALVIAASAMPITSDGPLATMDFQLRYLETWLRFIGIENIQALRVAPTFGPETEVTAAMASAGRQAEEFAAIF